jgi:hypothetical protein
VNDLGGHPLPLDWSWYGACNCEIVWGNCILFWAASHKGAISGHRDAMSGNIGGNTVSGRPALPLGDVSAAGGKITDERPLLRPLLPPQRWFPRQLVPPF